jgi:hypothetical protein
MGAPDIEAGCIHEATGARPSGRFTRRSSKTP